MARRLPPPALLSQGFGAAIVMGARRTKARRPWANIAASGPVVMRWRRPGHSTVRRAGADGLHLVDQQTTALCRTNGPAQPGRSADQTRLH